MFSSYVHHNHANTHTPTHTHPHTHHSEIGFVVIVVIILWRGVAALQQFFCLAVAGRPAKMGGGTSDRARARSGIIAAAAAMFAQNKATVPL